MMRALLLAFSLCPHMLGVGVGVGGGGRWVSMEQALCSLLAAAKSLQLCPTLYDPRDGSPPGSPVPEILQARTLEWVAISFSNAWKWKVKVKSLSSVQLFTTPWTAAYQASPSMGFSRQEYWSGVPLPSPREVMITEIKKQSPGTPVGIRRFRDDYKI